METAQRFEDLVVWQRAHAFVLAAYRLTRRFPREEMFGLTSQFRRAAVSIAANISEGFKKSGKADKLRFYNTAQGSIEECRYYVMLSRDLGYADPGGEAQLLEETSRLLESYMRPIRRQVFGRRAMLLFCILTSIFCLLQSHG